MLKLNPTTRLESVPRSKHNSPQL